MGQDTCTYTHRKHGHYGHLHACPGSAPLKYDTNAAYTTTLCAPSPPYPRPPRFFATVTFAHIHPHAPRFIAVTSPIFVRASSPPALETSTLKFAKSFQSFYLLYPSLNWCSLPHKPHTTLHTSRTHCTQVVHTAHKPYTTHTTRTHCTQAAHNLILRSTLTTLLRPTLKFPNLARKTVALALCENRAKQCRLRPVASPY
jgi:hypothetical protein